MQTPAIPVDLDRFKLISDNHGHEAGAEALRLFSKRLCENFRTSDVVARTGGDEFAILCSGTPSDQVEVALERLRAEFNASPLSQKHPELSWGAGTACFDPATDATIEDLLRMADARMYEAKLASKRRPRTAP